MDLHEAEAIQKAVKVHEGIDEGKAPFAKADAGDALAEGIRRTISGDDLKTLADRLHAVRDAYEAEGRLQDGEKDRSVGGPARRAVNEVETGGIPLEYASGMESDDQDMGMDNPLTFSNLFETEMTECGTFMDFGFGYHKREDDGISYMIAYPCDAQEGVWAVLSGFYSLDNQDREDYCDQEFMNDLLGRYGFNSLENLREAHPEDWREMLTCYVAALQDESRFAVPDYHATDMAVVKAFVSEGADADKVADEVKTARTAAMRGSNELESLEELARISSESMNTGRAETTQHQER